MRVSMIIVGVVFSARAASADDRSVLRLADVVGVAVRQSPELSRAKIDVDQARAELLAAEGIEDVHVGARGTAGSSSYDAIGQFMVSDVKRYGLTLFGRKLLASGGTLELDAGTAWI